MTESRGSKHVIFCDDCGKIFYYEEPYKEHKPCQRTFTRK